MTDRHPRSLRPGFLAGGVVPALVVAMIVAGCGGHGPQRLDGLGFVELAGKMADPDAAVRARAAAAMGGRRDPRAARVLLQASYDADATVRNAANKALAGILRMPTLPALAELAPVAVRLKTCEGRLLAMMKDPRAKIRAAAAAALGRIGERWVLEALIRRAATDKDPGVQEAAVLAIVSLGGRGGPVYGEVHAAFGRILLRRIPLVDFKEIKLKDAIQHIRDVTQLSTMINWAALGVAGVDGSTKVSLRQENQLAGVVICRLLLACKSSKPLAFVFDPKPLFSTTDDLAHGPSPRLREAARRAYSQAGRANQEAWRKLGGPAGMSSFGAAGFGDVMRRLSQVSGVAIRINHASLKKLGIDPGRPVTVWTMSHKSERSELQGYVGHGVLGAINAAISGVSFSEELDCLVDGGVVYIDTPDNLDARMFARPSAAGGSGDRSGG